MEGYSLVTTGSNILVDSILKEGEKHLIGKVSGIGYNVPNGKFQIGDVVLIPKKNSSKIQTGEETIYFINHCSIYCKLIPK